MTDKLVVHGARVHNLKNLTLELPRDKLVVFTGLSGSGKSSLAFDTIFAEGQRRYVESLSSYARQFLGEMDKPDVDHIDGLSPAISIDQKASSKNPRSTVGTITEIYDYLRVLWARIGHPLCPICWIPIQKQSTQQIIEQIMGIPEGERFLILAPVVRGRKGEYRELFQRLRKEGFLRVRVDGELKELEEQIELDKKIKHDIDIVIDRLVMKDDLRRRIADSVEQALKHSEGLALIWLIDKKEELLYSEKFACLQCGFSFPEISPRMFSFNSPHGACPSCTGLGVKLDIDPDLLVEDKGAAAWDAFPAFVEREIHWKKLQGLASEENIDLSTPWKELDQRDKDLILYGSGVEGEYKSFRNRFGKVRKYYTEYEGIVPALLRRHKDTESDWSRARIEEFMVPRTCESCSGARLKRESLAVLVGETNISDYCRLSIKEAIDFLDGLELNPSEQVVASRLMKEIKERLDFMKDVGLDYLSVDRAAATLSGGEAQRIRLATQIGSSLTGVLYVLDEPSIGLHPRDNERLLSSLDRLKNLGNTLIVVEHDEETIRAADHIVDIGPGAGLHGGEIVATGSAREIMANPRSITGQFLSGERQIPVPEKRREPQKRWLEIKGATEHNLKNIDVSIPLGLFVCVTGVSGSGKSTLIRDILYPALQKSLHNSRVYPGRHDALLGLEHIDKVIDIDQSPIGRTPRSNPATYTGLFDDVRRTFALTKEARARGYAPGRFSFNVKGGRCEACRGDGTLKIEMHFLPDVYVQCDVCHGRRYNAETLEVHYKDKNIYDLLEMSVDEALQFFSAVPAIERRLQTLSDVGLGYVKLGQSATTLSGGEAQRVKLATELSRKATGKTLYLLDEPTTGLHFADIEKLLEVLLRLVEAGNTVLVIEHNLEVIKTADWIIDLGPEGGRHGGTLVAMGSPEEISKNKKSYTARYIKEALENKRL